MEKRIDNFKLSEFGMASDDRNRNLVSEKSGVKLVYFRLMVSDGK